MPAANTLSSLWQFSDRATHDSVLSVVSALCVVYLPVLPCNTAFAFINKVLLVCACAHVWCICCQLCLPGCHWSWVLSWFARQEDRSPLNTSDQPVDMAIVNPDTVQMESSADQLKTGKESQHCSDATAPPTSSLSESDKENAVQVCWSRHFLPWLYFAVEAREGEMSRLCLIKSDLFWWPVISDHCLVPKFE